MTISKLARLRKYEVVCSVAAALGATVSFPAYCQDAAGSTPPPETTYKFYGVADVGVTNTDSGFGSKIRLDGGGGFSASRIGINVKRTFGDMSAIAVAEGGMLFNSGSVGAAAPAIGTNAAAVSSSGATGTGNQIFARQAFAGLQGSFGQVTFGRQYTGSYVAAAVLGAAHGDGLYGNSATVTPLIGGMPTRANNSVVWKTPKFGGLYVWSTYFTGNENNVASDTVTGAGATATTTNDKAGAGYDLAVIYGNGPLNATLTTWNVNGSSWASGAGETDLATKTGYQLAANYDFGSFKLFGTYVHGTISGGNYENVTKTLSDANGTGVSVLIPFGAHSVSYAYTQLSDNSLKHQDAKVQSISYWYTLAKDTTLYASYGRMENASTSSYALSDGGSLVGSVATPGFSPSGYQFGVNFTF